MSMHTYAQKGNAKHTPHMAGLTNDEKLSISIYHDRYDDREVLPVRRLHTDLGYTAVLVRYIGRGGTACSGVDLIDREGEVMEIYASPRHEEALMLREFAEYAKEVPEK